jgi:hypothetical protein
MYILSPSIERTEGYRRMEEPWDFISADQYDALAPDDRQSYTFDVKAELDLRFQDHERHLTRSHREIARYEVLDGKTRQEAGLGPDADRSNSPLYREDLVGLDNPEAEFIAQAREDVDWLLERLASLRRLIDFDREFRPEDGDDEAGWRRWDAGVCEQLDTLEEVLR